MRGILIRPSDALHGCVLLLFCRRLERRVSLRPCQRRSFAAIYYTSMTLVMHNSRCVISAHTDTEEVLTTRSTVRLFLRDCCARRRGAFTSRWEERGVLALEG